MPVHTPLLQLYHSPSHQGQSLIQGLSLYNMLMPSRNSLKEFAGDAYYHLYNRGVNKQIIFTEDQDFVVFLSLLKRHLDKEPHFDKQQREYPHLPKQISLLSYCLMPNHFHLLIHNKESHGIELLMRSVATAYVSYFNRKYKRVGPLFQGRYKASMIDSDTYLQHISRYIHLNPREYEKYKYSSYKAIVENWNVGWLATEELMNTFEGTRKDYAEFVADYEDHKAMLDEIKHDLADT